MTREERFKGSVHAVTGGLAMTMCLYNLLRCVQADRPAPRNVVNTVGYGVLWAWETYQTCYHWGLKDNH